MVTHLIRAHSSEIFVLLYCPQQAALPSQSPQCASSMPLSSLALPHSTTLSPQVKYELCLCQHLHFPLPLLRKLSFPANFDDVSVAALIYNEHQPFKFRQKKKVAFFSVFQKAIWNITMLNDTYHFLMPSTIPIPYSISLLSLQQALVDRDFKTHQVRK